MDWPNFGYSTETGSTPARDSTADQLRRSARGNERMIDNGHAYESSLRLSASMAATG